MLEMTEYAYEGAESLMLFAMIQVIYTTENRESMKQTIIKKR